MSYISHVDYKKMMDGFKKGAPKQMLSESLDPVGKEDGDIDNDGDKDKTDKYLAKRRQAVGKAIGKGRMMKESDPTNDQWYEDFEDGLRNLANNKYISRLELQHYMQALDHVDPMDNYSDMVGHDAAKQFVDDLRTKDQMDADKEQWSREGGDDDYDEYPADHDTFSDFNDGEFWENEIKKLQEIAGVGPQDDGPEDDDEEEREARRKKREMDDEEAENAERDEFDENAEGKVNMHDPNAAAKIVAQKHGTQLKPELAVYKKSHNDYLQAIRQYDNKDPKFREIATAHNKLVKDFQNKAINLAGEEMLASGMSKVEVRNLLSGYGYFEDWLPDYISTLHKELGDVAEGLHMPPLQATGQTIVTNEDQAPFGMSVLSPDERKQLKEYINSYKTIKSEISKLLEKAGKSGRIMEATVAEDEAVPAARKAVYRDPTTVPTQKHKHSNLGGNRTGLVMTKAEMWEGDEGHESIESALGEKLHSTFNKVTQMAIKQIVADGWDPDQAVSFLQAEIEEHAKEATMSQYDPH